MDWPQNPLPILLHSWRGEGRRACSERVKLRRERKFVLVVPLFLIPLLNFSLAIEFIICPQLYLASDSTLLSLPQASFPFYFLLHPMEKGNWQSSLVNSWQATSQSQTHGDNAGETEKVSSSFSPQIHCREHREGPNLENKPCQTPVHCTYLQQDI